MLSDTLATGVVVGGAAVTVTAQVAVFVGSDTEATVIVTLPDLWAVTTPVDETDAISVLLLFHVTALFVAVAGAMVAARVSVLPAVRVIVDLLSDTPVTGTVVTGAGLVRVLNPR